MNVGNRRLKIAFIHPDLGIGGAERLMVDAALYLQRAGHRVTLFAGHYDPGHCFDATRDGTLDIRTYFFPVPIQMAQRLRALCTMARLSYLAARLAFSGRYDVVFSDLIPQIVPLLRLLSGAPVVYYCHYPDNYPRVVSPYEKNFLFRLYRNPIDRLEQAGIRRADRILVNSWFTAARLRRAYPFVETAPIEVVYPGVDPELYPDLPRPETGKVTLLSINRLVPHKNIVLSIEALAQVRATLAPEVFRRVRLVLVGGYDARLAESRAVLAELKATVERLDLINHVEFRLSCSETERLELLSACRCFVYTPDEEHFGYGPVEAMAAGRPVIAVKSGGPLETVLDGETGMLCEPTVASFAAAMVKLILDAVEADRLGRAGRRRARERFSLASFGRHIESILLDVTHGPGRAPRAGTDRSPKAAEALKQ